MRTLACVCVSGFRDTMKYLWTTYSKISSHIFFYPVTIDRNCNTIHKPMDFSITAFCKHQCRSMGPILLERPAIGYKG